MFLGAKAPHRCRLAEEPPDATYHDFRHLEQDKVVWEADTELPSSCSMYHTDGNLTSCHHGWLFDTDTFGSRYAMSYHAI